MAAIEKRLSRDGETLAPGELEAAIADFGAVEPGLRRYAGD
jgi:hypothetical protein